MLGTQDLIERGAVVLQGVGIGPERLEMAAEGGIIALLQRGLRRDEQLIGLRAAGERVVFLLRTLKRLSRASSRAFSASLKRVSVLRELVC